MKATSDDTDSDSIKLQILKQRAIASVLSNRNKLNSSALLKDDDMIDDTNDNHNNSNSNTSASSKDDHLDNSHTFCRGIVQNIVDNVNKDKPITNKKQSLADLRALALKSLLTSTNTNTNTTIVDMDISPNVSPETNSTSSKESIVNESNSVNTINDAQSENATFTAETQKLSLILSQIRKKDEERKNLALLAKKTADKLHIYVDKFDLPFDLHHVLDGMIVQHIKCPNCSINETKQMLELQRQKQKYKRHIKKLQQKLNPKKKSKNRDKSRNQEQQEMVLLDETMEQLHIDQHYGIDHTICLSDIYDMENAKCLDHELINKEDKKLIESKIEKHLLLYYIQV